MVGAFFDLNFSEKLGFTIFSSGLAVIIVHSLSPGIAYGVAARVRRTRGS